MGQKLRTFIFAFAESFICHGVPAYFMDPPANSYVKVKIAWQKRKICIVGGFFPRLVAKSRNFPCGLLLFYFSALYFSRFSVIWVNILLNLGRFCAKLWSIFFKQEFERTLVWLNFSQLYFDSFSLLVCFSFYSVLHIMDLDLTYLLFCKNQE